MKHRKNCLPAWLSCLAVFHLAATAAQPTDAIDFTSAAHGGEGN